MAGVMTLRAAEYSTLSNLAYSSNLKTSAFGWIPIERFSRSESSGLSVTTFQRGNDVVISFRGTDSLRDMVANSSFVLASWDKQFHEAASLVSQVKSFFPNARISLVGHSLGGAIAQIMAKMFNLPGASFDAPGASAVTNTRGYLEAKSKYAGNVVEEQDSGSFINYISKGSLISSIGTHIGGLEVLSLEDSTSSSSTFFSLVSAFAFPLQKGCLDGKNAGRQYLANSSYSRHGTHAVGQGAAGRATFLR